MKNNLLWITTYTCLAKVYSNSLMAGLNARNNLRHFKPETFYELGAQLENTQSLAQKDRNHSDRQSKSTQENLTFASFPSTRSNVTVSA
ncbi:hypothetical protein F5879DRAFT_696346 [Lentinula edodes]|nr:hypothetical protein F5879DRAFT_696346 [Lentinula edodes]